MKTLKYRTIASITGRPYRLPKLDEDGNIIWKEGYAPGVPLQQRAAHVEDADTVSIIRHIITSMPRDIQAPHDSFRAYKLLGNLQVADGKVELDDNEYDWLHRVLSKRKMPMTREAKEANAQQLTYGRWLFGMSDYAIIAQLTDVDSTPPEPSLDD